MRDFIPRRGRGIVSHVSELIGRTPLFEVCVTGSGVRLLLKLEQFNPTGSAKVRMAEQMIADAEREGKLRPGGRIVEPTSGNTGLGLALAALERGYRFTAVVDHHASKDKLRAMAALGAELVYVGGEGGGELRSVERRRVAAELVAADREAYWPDQHNHPGNGGGYRELAKELLADAGQVDWLIGAIGTGGSLCGTVRELRRLRCPARTLAVEPAGSIIFGAPPGPYRQTGSGSPEGFPVGANVCRDLIDEGVQASDVDAFATARALARHTGLMVGGSAGGAIHAALNRIDTMRPGSTAVVLVCDAGEKYLDTVFDDEWLRGHGLHAPEIEAEVGKRLGRHEDVGLRWVS
ncbi:MULTISPECIES: PLP-dependent cysteine synthase family protein [Amycolatopsis]|uniref:PLP-dependent cysteine synthase family protein n=2 Tax=Amycolatopsis TaxID=1813 RepID=A0ABW5I6A1_9PSEU